MVQVSGHVKRLVRTLSGNGKGVPFLSSNPSPHLAFSLVRGSRPSGDAVSYSSSDSYCQRQESPKSHNLPKVKEVDGKPDKTLVTKLLSQFKQTSEVREYLKLFGSVDSMRFAIVKISGDVLGDATETAKVAANLAFLHKMGLVPIVVHGAGLYTGRQAAEVQAAALSGNAEQLMAAAQETMRRCNAALVAALQKEGVGAVPLVSGVFSAERDTAHYGLLGSAAGTITGVSADAISTAVEAGCIPVVAALSSVEDVDGRASAPLTFSTQEATLALAKLVRPLKVIALRSEGGLRRTDGAPLRAVDLARDAPALLQLLEDLTAPAGRAPSPAAGVWAGHFSDAALLLSVASSLGLTPMDALCLVELASLYSVLDEPGATVAATTPDGLAEELLSHKGAGTLVRRGARITAFDSLDGVDVPRVVALIEAAFRAELPSGFFEELVRSGRLRRLYLSDDYRGVALVTTEPGLPGVSYLDKFAVDPSAQGDKLGEELWKSMVEHEPQLYWRSRSTNRVNAWYYEHADGCLKAKAGDWTVFWRGLDSEDVMSAVKAALDIKPTFAARVYPAADGSSKTPPAQQPVLK